MKAVMGEGGQGGVFIVSLVCVGGGRQEAVFSQLAGAQSSMGGINCYYKKKGGPEPASLPETESEGNNLLLIWAPPTLSTLTPMTHLYP